MMERPSMIREVPLPERPRERLLEHGGEALSDAELIAVLLRTGRRGASALELAREVLLDAGGLAGLVGMPPETVQRSGVGAAKTAALLAAVELGCRLARQDMPDRLALARPASVASYLVLRYRKRDQEVMGALFLDARNRLICEREIYRGTMSRAAAEPREVLKEALVRGASAVVLFHTHPSGDPSPSLEDLQFTRRMAEAAGVLGIRLVDHLILGGTGSWVSLKQRGAW